MTIEVDPAAVRAAAEQARIAEDVLAAVWPTVGNALELAASRAGDPDVAAAASALSARVGELFAALDAAHDAARQGLDAASAAVLRNDADTVADIDVLAATFSTSVAGYRG